MVGAGSGDLQREPGLGLPGDLGEVGHRTGRLRFRGCHLPPGRAAGRLSVRFPAEGADDVVQMGEAADFSAGDQSGLGLRVLGDDHLGAPRVDGGHHHRHGLRRAVQGAVEAELGQEHGPLDVPHPPVRGVGRQDDRQGISTTKTPKRKNAPAVLEHPGAWTPRR